MIIKKFSPNSVRRFYQKNFFYVILKALGEGNLIAEKLQIQVAKYAVEFANRGIIVDPDGRLQTHPGVAEVLSECLRLQFVRNIDGWYKLTTLGQKLFQAFEEGKESTVDAILCQEMEKHFGVFSVLINSMFTASQSGGLILFPKPYPKDFGSSTKKLQDVNAVEEYVKKLLKYSDDLLKKSTNLRLDSGKLYNEINFNIKAYLEYIKKQEIKNPNLTKVIRNTMYDHYIKLYFGDTFDRTSYNIWLERGIELGIINSSEYFPRLFSTVIYPISKYVSDDVKLDSNFTCVLRNEKEGKSLYKFTPNYIFFKEQFVSTLWKVYTDLSTYSSSFFISLHDLRDVLCFQLQLSNKIFNEFLENVYKESINSTIEWDISLEVDKLPEQRKFFRSKRFPILIDNLPKNIIGIKIKSR